MLRPRTVPTTLTALALAGTLTACATDAQDSPGDEATVMGHVHGLGVDPGDDTLYVASHFGVFRVEDGEPARVADRWQDTMGFAVVGPGHFLGSGHPDLTEDLPSSLGLIESTDGAQTWQPVSLEGEADFHAIEPVGDRIYGYDSHSGALMVTTDRRRWATIAEQPLLDLAADPGRPDTIYATTDRGQLVSSTDGDPLAPLAGAPTLTVIDWQAGGSLVGVAPDGAVLTSADGRSDWTRVGTLDGPAAALDASPGRWHAATESGIHESTDDGATWGRLIDSHG